MRTSVNMENKVKDLLPEMSHPQLIRWFQRLRVIPDDMGRIPVGGSFVAANDYEIILRRSTDELGNVNVNFPRAGFDVISLE